MSTGPDTPTDHHHASRSGAKTEDTVAEVIKALGWDFAKKKAEVEALGVPYEGNIRIPKPAIFQQIHEGWGFETDGYMRSPEGREFIIEIKSHNAKLANGKPNGTAQEKVFYDLEKLRRGAYSNSPRLIYLFTGAMAHDVNEWSAFASIVEEENLPADVIFDNSANLSSLCHFLLSNERHEDSK